MVDSSGQAGKDQRHDIRCAAQDAMAGAAPVAGPVAIDITFYFARPKAHFGTGKNADAIRNDAPLVHTKKPDADKLARQVLDGLTGIVYVDDSQVWRLSVIKGYAAQPGTKIHVEAGQP